MTKPVMIVGASGVFGSHVARQLAETGMCDFVLAGRDERKAAGIIQMLRAKGCTVQFARFDRSAPDTGTLRNLDPAVVIDAAGPFQGSSLALPEACISAGVAYIDLADARDFVGKIPSLDEKAKAAGVAIISGASSTPALSHAVLDELTGRWQSVHSILVAISPGNRAPRGASVVKAILSYAGEPVRLFRNGTWQIVSGWTQTECIDIPGIGPRRVSLCETPDLDLLVQRYQPKVAAEFKAGLELGIMHHGLRLLAWLRARGLMPPLKHFARPLRLAASCLSRFGGDRGGMLVQATGISSDGKPVRARWSLAAASGRGPIIPSLPAVALVHRRAELGKGARSAAGLLTLEEMLSHFERLGVRIESSVEVMTGTDVFEQALGPVWQTLPEITRAIHRAQPSIALVGEAHVEGAENAIGRWLAKTFGFPEAAERVPVKVIIESDGTREKWQRIYPTRIMRSVMTRPDCKRSTVEEWLGPFRFRLLLVGSRSGIDLLPQAVRLWGMPLPLWLLPRIAATERANADGSRHLFDVLISLPVVGRLVHYRGWLEPA